MKFRTFFLLVMRLYWTHQPFTARDLSSKLQMTCLATGFDFRYPLAGNKIRTKLVSNNLRRLYMMGFLRRKRIKRTVRRSGKIRNIGYEYTYQVSLRSLQYLEYLANPIQTKSRHEEDLENRGKLWTKRRIRFEFPDLSSEEKDILIELCGKTKIGLRKSRFPLRFGGLLGLRYLVARKMVRNEGVDDIKFELEFNRIRLSMEVIYPHLRDVLRDDSDLSIPDADAPFLELLWLLPSPPEIAAEFARTADQKNRRLIPLVFEHIGNVNPVFARLSKRYQRR